MTDLPELPPEPRSTAHQWFRDWTIAFYDLMMKNVFSGDTGKLDLEQNRRLGEILKTVEGNNQ